METHSSFLAWKIPWTEEPGELQSVGPQRVLHNLATVHTHTHTHTRISLAKIIQIITKWGSPKLARQIGSRGFVVFFPEDPPIASMKLQPGSLL